MKKHLKMERRSMKKHIKMERRIVGRKQENDCRYTERDRKRTKISKRKQGYKKRR